MMFKPKINVFLKPKYDKIVFVHENGGVFEFDNFFIRFKEDSVEFSEYCDFIPVLMYIPFSEVRRIKVTDKNGKYIEL